MNYKGADYDEINKKLRDTFPGTLENLNSAQHQFDVFLTALKEAINLHVPQMRSIPRKPTNKPWISKDTQKLIKRKLTLWSRYTLTGTEEAYKNYRKLNNKLTNHCKSCRIAYETDLLQAGPKKFYSYIGQKITSKISVPTVQRNKEGQTVTQAHEIAEALAVQFVGVFQKEPQSNLPILDPSLRVEETITEIIFTEEIIQQAIKEMNTDSSPGPDDIPVTILQKCVLTNTLANIMQTSYDTGTLPVNGEQQQ